MTTQGERTPTPGEGLNGQAGRRTGGAAGAGAELAGGDAAGTEQDLTGGRSPGRTGGRNRRLTARRAVGWVVVVGVVAAGGWIITRPMPGDYIPGLGPSSKDASRTPPVVGAPPPRTDPEGLVADAYFPPQRPIEAGAYKARRNGIRQGENCTEVLQDRTQELLRDSGCQAYLTLSFTGQDRPVLSSVTVLRFGDQAAAVKAAETLRGKPGALAFILPDASAAPVAPSGAPKAAVEPRVAAVGHYVTVTNSRLSDARTPGAGASPVPSAPVAVPSGPAPSNEQILDEANRALSYAAGAPFVWM
ncbi:hypothetical protein ACIRS1_13815 [Kitasatospora sp. NPDC101176]|uniref:hypothetical protein n=1 Tax=Kitasatospora sp. NPDC101176 TaxID=3364099 RepID=UPI0038160071